MKKIVLLLLAVGFAWGLKAQSDFSFGPKVGLNFTNISNTDANNKTSIHAGIFASARLTEWVGMQMEFLYSRQGIADKYKENGATVKLKGRVNYLNLPVLAKVNLYKNVTFDLGPQFGFALNAKAKTKSGGTVVKEKLHDLNFFDLSFALGVSYEPDSRLVMSARYYLGITHVFDADAFGSNNKNRVFQLSLGYKLAS